MSTKKEEKIICPKCGQPCSWTVESEGSVFCVHYLGYEKTSDGKIKKKIKKHYMGRVQYVLGRPGLQPLLRVKDELKHIEERIKIIEEEIAKEKDEQKKEELLRKREELEKEKEGLERRVKEIETKNIHLLPADDKERFLKYIKESLELMQLQDDFDERKIMKVLDIIESFLKDNKEILSEKTLAKVRLIENDVVNAIYSRQG
uniref:Uncharacterized protein n=1 Tax=Sulfolobus neozealandicus TaxID=299422 RepID=Q5NE01_9CREN|nr:hypothetical protein [Sulfolobus neozealandicus]CAH89326.1 hypothetical protein [Sulfolobus neozealandicus]